MLKRDGPTFVILTPTKPLPPREATPYRQNYDRFTARAPGGPPLAAKVHRPIRYRLDKEPERAVLRSGPAPKRCRQTGLE